MKAFATLLLILFCALMSHAQDRKPETRVETTAKGLIPVSRILQKMDPETPQVARLYRRPHARVKKALTFANPANRPKVA